MSRLFKILPINMTVGIFMIVFTLIPSIIFSALISTTASFMIKDKYSRDYIQLITSSVDKNMSMIITQLSLTALGMTQNPGVYNALYSASSEESRQSSLEGYLQMMVDKTPYVSGIEFYSNNELVCRYPFGSDFPSVDESFYNSIDNHSIYLGEQYVKYKEKSYLPVAKVMYQFERNFAMGTAVMYVDSNIFREAFSSLPIYSSTFYITVNDSIIFDLRENNVGKFLYIPDFSAFGFSSKANGFVKSVNPVSVDNLADDVKISAIISHKDIYESMQSANRRIITIFAVTSLITFLLAFFISRFIVSDIKALTKNVLELKKNNKLHKINRTNNEIFILQQQFNDMFEKINQLITLNNKTQKKLYDAEFQALQAGISPHFLYNSLDSICCMAKLNKQSDIELLAYSISQYYRYAFTDNDSFVIPMSDEINHAKNYLMIKKTHYPDLFDFEIDVSDEVRGCSVIKFILQPIVENSVKHGFKDITYKGLITITGEIADDASILITVTDNGCGMNFNPIDNPSSSSYGIKNINERIKLASNKSYGLSFYSLPSLGTKVVIKLPRNYRKENDDPDIINFN